jgi:hypothetical protein
MARLYHRASEGPPERAAFVNPAGGRLLRMLRLVVIVVGADLRW